MEEKSQVRRRNFGIESKGQYLVHGIVIDDDLQLPSKKITYLKNIEATRSMLISKLLVNFICVVAFCKVVSSAFSMTTIIVACATNCFIATLFFSPAAFGFRVVFPSIDGIGSFLSLVRDPSLVPPFNIAPSDLNEDNDNIEDTKADISPNRRDDDVGATLVPGADVTHFCFLLHGFHGLSSDLSYFEAVMNRWVCDERKRQSDRHRKQKECEMDNGFVVIRNAPTDDFVDGKVYMPEIHDMVIRNSICNEGQTTDGLVNGGDRLIDEMRKTIHSEMELRQPELNVDGEQTFKTEDKDDKVTEREFDQITISIVGNSMGGLYGRYAIAKLIDRYCVSEKSTRSKDDDDDEGKEQGPPASSWILDGKYRLRLNLFCSTAAPHLGVSQHTWIRIPRIAEIAIAHFMGQSGRDMFRLNNLVYTMGTDSCFLDPLASFRTRIAYANCYGTDFPVPVETAAFLSDKSAYPHKFSNECEDECGLVVATMSTPSANKAEEQFDKDPENKAVDELHRMSVSLDKLGWKKVFVDLRKEMMSVEFPRPRWLRRQHSDYLRFGADKSGSGRVANNTNDFHGLKQQKTVSSKDIVRAINTAQGNHREDERLTLRVPAGHNMIVAFSRSRIGAFVNKGGRPLVDALAKELVQEIFAWDEPERRHKN